jgi:hypothetical protein
MSIQPIDVPSLLRAVIWPLISALICVVFRRELRDLIPIFSRRLSKISFGTLSVELAKVPEVTPPPALDAEIRQPEAGLIPQSGVPGLTGLINRLATGGKYDYIVIDLGSESSPRWLTSRLYLLTYLLMLLDSSSRLVFTETIGGVRGRFVGAAAPSRVRWALARKYSWLESAGVAAHAMVGGLTCITMGQGCQLSLANTLYFDEKNGMLVDYELSQLVQNFLTFVRVPPPAPTPDATDWVTMANQMIEHARWLDGGLIGRMLGDDLNKSYCVRQPNEPTGDLTQAVIRQDGRFVAVVEPDKTFHGLVDRSKMLEMLSKEFEKISAQKKP